MQLATVGLGYVGLPLSVEFARAGIHVTGIDIDGNKIDAIRSGESYVRDVPSSTVRKLVEEGTFSATSEFDVLAEKDAVIICVPTPLSKTKDPDLSLVINAATEIAKRLRPGQLIVLESTTYPGTTEELILPRLKESGLRVGEGFFLAFSPERVDPGNTTWNTRNTPKIIGGTTPNCLEAACALYSHAVERVIPVSSTRTAEMVKLLENTFRSVNIGLVNEVALMCDRLGVDVWEVIDAAATKPFGLHAVLSRTRSGRSLHPHRSVLSILEAQNAELQGALHRVGRRNQLGNALLRGQQDSRRAERKTEER